MCGLREEVLARLAGATMPAMWPTPLSEDAKPDYVVTHRVLSEMVSIKAGRARFRAVCSVAVGASGRDGSAPHSATWTLWHDDQDGGSHTVGHMGAYACLSDALDASVGHDHRCRR